MPRRPALPCLTDADAPLSETLRVLNERRRFVALLGGLGFAALLPRPSLACTLINRETEGPYPGDGTNGPNVLTQSGIVRSDIRSSFGASGTNVATGTPLALSLQFLSTVDSCGPIEGLAVYVWHCDRQGRYSMYSQGISNENYLRGVQVSDANGRVSFTSIFPACYDGRWPHIHFEIFASLEDATNGHNAGRISQLALPRTACDTVYAQSALYPSSASNLARFTQDYADNVFGEDDAQGGVEVATVSGNTTDGYTAFLEVGLAVDATSTDLIYSDGFEAA